MTDLGKYGYSIMNKELEKSLWDKICNEFKFVPDHTSVPYSWIELPMPFKLYQLDFSVVGTHWDRLMNSLFVQLGSFELYALDWQHDSFVFSPRNYWKLVKEYYDDERGCNVYFPHFYPDGDYYFFVDPQWKYGIFGHPWLKQIAVFGKELIERVENHSKMLGLSQVCIIDKFREYMHGDSADDIDEYLRRYSGVALIDVKPVLCHTCGSDRLKIWVDEEEDAIQVGCTECGFKKIILDCEDVWEDADPHAGICPECKSKVYNIRVGFVRRDNGNVKHVYIGNRCPKCGLLGSYLDWPIEYEPTDTMENNI